MSDMKTLLQLITKFTLAILVGYSSLASKNAGLFYRLRLNTMTLQVTSTSVYSGQGVSISVTGIAQVEAV